MHECIRAVHAVQELNYDCRHEPRLTTKSTFQNPSSMTQPRGGNKIKGRDINNCVGKRRRGLFNTPLIKIKRGIQERCNNEKSCNELETF